MTREEQLKFCKVCTNRNMNREKGLVCRLTDDYASFEDECDDFNRDDIEVVLENEKRDSILDTASGQKRFANYLIDKILFYAFAFLFGGVIGFTGLGDEIIEGMNDYVLGYLLMLCYYIFFESVFAQTPGKMITKTIVVNRNGEKPSFLNVVGRTLCRFIPFDHFSFLGPSASGFHDKISKTAVVNISSVSVLSSTGDDNSFIEDESDTPFSYKWDFLPKKHIFHLLGFYSLAALIYFSLSFPFFGENSTLFPFIFLVPLIPLWQSNLLSKRGNKRFFHLQTRLLFVLTFTLFIEFRKYFFYNEYSFFNTLLTIILLAIISSISSVIVFHWKIKLFTNPKYYFIRFTRIFIPIAIIFILVFSTFRGGWFISKQGEFKHWNDVPLTYNDFRGYPDLFSEYNAAILSEIKFEFDSEDNILFIDAVCNRNKTWVNPWDKEESYFLLQHENYHFHLTEAVTRMARKKVYETIQAGYGRKKIEKILYNHRVILSEMQDRYDVETNHSIIQNQQSLWQFKIDSILGEYDSYWTSNIFKQGISQDSIQYFREININGINELQGNHRLLPNEEAYTEHYKITYGKNRKINKIEYYFQGKLYLDQYYEAAIIKINYVSASETNWLFYDTENKPIMNNDGFHKSNIVYKNGFKTISYFDINENPTAHVNNYFSAKIKQDSFGRRTEKVFYDKRNVQIANKNGRYLNKYYYDNDATLFSYKTENYSSSGKPMNDVDGHFRKTYIYDEYNNIIRINFKDKNGILTRSTLYEYNELGHVNVKYKIDKDKKLIEDEDGIAKYVWKYDRYGNSNRMSYYNGNNVLTTDKDGNAILVRKYNGNNNNLSLLANYDTGGLLIYDNDSYGKVKYQYDSLNRLKYCINYNGYDYPVKPAESGAVQLQTYDSLNGLSILTFLDAYYKPDTSVLGISHQVRIYDENENLKRVSLYDLENNLAPMQEDVAIFRYQYDKNGNKLKSSFYTVDDKPAYANQGAFINKYKYSPNNLMIERSYYDTTLHLIDYNGFSKIKWKYDDKDNEIETQYFNSNNLLVDSGTAIYKYIYDDKNNQIEEIGYNSEELLISRTVASYDENNNQTSIAYYGLDNKPITDESGIHKYQYVFENNLILSEKFYDTKGKLYELDGVATTKYERDTRGNVLVKETYNKSNQLTLNYEGYAVSKYKYDLYDRLIEEIYYDENVSLTVMESAYSTVRYKRDNSGNLLEKCFYDNEDNIVEDNDGVALYTWTYNRNGAVEKDKTYSTAEAEVYLNDYNWSEFKED